MVTFYDLIGFFLCICTPCTLQMIMIIMINNNNDHNKMKILYNRLCSWLDVDIKACLYEY